MWFRYIATCPFLAALNLKPRSTSDNIGQGACLPPLLQGSLPWSPCFRAFGCDGKETLSQFLALVCIERGSRANSTRSNPSVGRDSVCCRVLAHGSLFQGGEKPWPSEGVLTHRPTAQRSGRIVFLHLLPNMKHRLFASRCCSVGMQLIHGCCSIFITRS